MKSGFLIVSMLILNILLSSAAASAPIYPPSISPAGNAPSPSPISKIASAPSPKHSGSTRLSGSDGVRVVVALVLDAFAF